MKLKDTNAGFTLIELLVVIAIIGVLAAVVLLAINPAKLLKQSRDSRRKAEVKQMVQGIGSYLLANGSLPEGFTAYGALIKYDRSFESTFLDDLVAAGIFAVAPSDPNEAPGDTPTGPNPFYIYYQNATRSPTVPGYVAKQDSYIITAWLERRDDPDCITNSNGTVYTSGNPGLASYCLYLVVNGGLIKSWN